MPMATKSRRKFIVLDGVEGCGKSTQCELLTEALRKAGRRVTRIFEPGVGKTGKKIRRLIFGPESEDLDSMTEMLLFSADRREHFLKVIWPALSRGRVVICDRSWSASYAYQGFAGGVPLREVERISMMAMRYRPLDKPCLPFVIVLDITPRAGFERKGGKGPDRMEQKQSEYHERVGEGFRVFCREHPDSTAKVAADGTIAEVHQAIIAVVNKKFEELEWNIRPVLC